jgi:hypothetical protein
MSTQVFLLSETKLREFTDINNNVDTELLRNGIREAQDIHLQRLTGTVLYNKLLSDVSTSSLTGSYQYLVDNYVQDMLLYAAYYESLEAIYIRPRNNGLLTPTGGDNSREVDLQIYNMKRESVKNKMEWYAERLVNYLIENQNVFPELNQNNYLYEQNPDYGSQFRSPIVFGNAVRGTHFKQAVRSGLPITDSRYPQFPPPEIRFEK